jgi:hypothetical protein
MLEDVLLWDISEYSLILGGLLSIFNYVSGFEKILPAMKLKNDMLIMWMEQLKLIKVPEEDTRILWTDKPQDVLERKSISKSYKSVRVLNTE